VKHSSITRRRNPSALAIARTDPLGRIAVPMMAIALGSAAGILAAKPLGKTPMTGGLVGAAAGLAAFLLVDQVDQRR
jgi:hypothetical protein